MPTTVSVLDEFVQIGFVVFEQVFTPDEMQQIDDAFESLYATSQIVAATPGRGASVTHNGARFSYAAGSDHVRHVAMCGNVEPDLMRFGRDQRLLKIAAQLLGTGEMDQLINQAHYKRPGSNVVFDWHQDAQHRGMAQSHFTDLNGRGSYAQLLLAVDDSTSENGGLQFIPGTSRLGLLAGKVEEQVNLATAVTPTLRRGDVVAFGPYTVHGSQANRSDRSRRVFINGFAQPGANRRDYGLPGAGDRLVIAS